MISWRDYALLARWDKPIGVWLLLIPCWWGLLLFSPDLSLDLFLYGFYFACGAILLRGAGCVWNDILDRGADVLVERTRGRPIASGRVSVRSALVFMFLQVLLGGVILLQFSVGVILVCLCSLFLVMLYPLMKRVTYWPQAWLGLTFNWGVWVGGFAFGFGVDYWILLLFYFGCIFWTLGYDTIYAMQDRGDDIRIGVGSTAVLFGDFVIWWVILFYVIFHGVFGVVGFLLGYGYLFWLFWVLGSFHLVWQVCRFGGGEYGLIFRSNRDYGLLMVLGLLLG